MNLKSIDILQENCDAILETYASMTFDLNDLYNVKKYIQSRRKYYIHQSVYYG